MPELKFGNYVSYAIPADVSHGAGYVIGYPKYAVDGDVVVLASTQYIGMPISAAHCTLLSSGAEDEEIARGLRARYDEKHPGFMHALEVE